MTQSPLFLNWLTGQPMPIGYFESAENYGAIGDVVQAQYTLSITSGSTALTAVGASFASSDVGKLISIPGAGAAGAGLSTTIAAVTGATTVTLGASASTTLSAVSSYIAYGTNQTTKLQNWINQLILNGRPGYLPPGAYAINAALSAALTNFNGIIILGASTMDSNRSVIVLFNYTQDGIDVTAASGNSGSVLFEGIEIQGAPNASFSSGLMMAGNGFSVSSPSAQIIGPVIRDCRTYGLFTGMSFNNVGLFTVDTCQIQNPPSLANVAGISISGLNCDDNSILNTWITGPNLVQQSNNSFGNAIVQSGGTNVKITGSEIYGWVNGVLVFMQSGAGAGANPSGGLLIANSVIGPVDFAVSLNKNAGTAYSNVSITANQIVCKGGINDDSNAGWLSDVQVIGNWFDLGNGIATGAGTGVALNNTTNLVVSGNIFVQTTAGCTGVSTGSGTTHGTITDNVFNGVTTPLSNSSTSVIVHDNPGYNPVGVSAAVVMGASPFTYTAGASPETHYVNQSATNTATIAKGTRQIAALVNASTYYAVQLGPFESYVTTWATTAPTYTKDVH